MIKGISVLLPAYKEAVNLSFLLPNINSVLSLLSVPSEILVIDTIVPMDNTKEICVENSVLYGNRENGNFYGDAIRTGIDKAQYSYLVIMDADGSHDPNEIINFFNEIEKYDLIIGSRYVKGGYTDNNFILKAMSYILNCTYRFVFGIKAKDISNSFRMYKTKDLKNIKLECNDFDIVEEILIKLQIKNKNIMIKEIPVSFNKREHGESKRDLKKFILSYLKTMKKLYDIRLNAEGKENLLSTRIIKFIITGGVGSLLNLFVFFIMADCFSINATISSCIAFMVAVTHNYIVNQTWTFKFQNSEKKSIFQWIKYIVSNLIGLVVNLVILNGLLHLFMWSYETIPQMIGIIVGFVFNFIFANLLVFRKHGCNK